MARKARELIGNVFDRTPTRDQIQVALQTHKLTYSVFGFIPATDATDNAILLSNLGYVLGELDLNVCLLDFKVFQPNLYLLLDVPQNKRGEGLLTILKDDKVDIREQINQTKYEGLYLLSPSPQDLMEEYFDFNLDKIQYVIETLKRLFDVVLIDIPYNPPLEFCVGAMKHSHIGFFTASERVDALSNVTRLLDFARSLGVSVGKYTNIVFNNLQDLHYDFGMLKKLKFNIVANLPLLKGTLTDALEGRIYIRDNPLVNAQYKKELEKIIHMMLMQA